MDPDPEQDELDQEQRRQSLASLAAMQVQDEAQRPITFDESWVTVAAGKFKRKLARPLLNSEPLLKFDEQDKPYLDPAGMRVIAGLKGKICPIVFIGDARAGKSYLASRLIGSHDAFVSSDFSESVTEGIDIAVVLAPGTRDNLLVLDCEGGNNAMAKIRSLVNVFAVVACTQVVFVANSMFSEAALENVATAMAARSLVQFGTESGVELPRRLTFVVNKTTLNYEGDPLEKTLNQTFNFLCNRAELRQGIKDIFLERRFFAVTVSGLPNFEDSIKTYLDGVIDGRRPLQVGGEFVSGIQLCRMLEIVRTEVAMQSHVSAPSVIRGVIFDGFLEPLAKACLVEAHKRYPEESEDYDPRLPEIDQTSWALAQFQSKTKHMEQRFPGLISEAQQIIINDLKALYERLSLQNETQGEKIVEITTESRHIVESTRPELLGGKSLLRNLIVQQESGQVEVRSVVCKKRHRFQEREGEFGNWVVTGSGFTRLADLGLRDRFLGQHRMRARVLRWESTVLHQVCGSKLAQPCLLVLQDFHLMWWDGPLSMDDIPDHWYCLMDARRIGKLSLDVPNHVDSGLAPENNVLIVRVLSDQNGTISTFYFDLEAASASEWLIAFEEQKAFAENIVGMFQGQGLPSPTSVRNVFEASGCIYADQDLLAPPTDKVQKLFGMGRSICAQLASKCKAFVQKMFSSQASRQVPKPKPEIIEMSQRRPLRDPEV